MTGVVVAGEALVDLVPRADGSTPRADGSTPLPGLTPLPGGSSLNVAVGLGRQEVTARYLGTLGRHGFAPLLVDRLGVAGVDVSLAPRVELPTTLAVVHLDADDRATYGFYLAGTTAASLRVDQLPALPDGDVLHVSFGAVGMTHDPAGRALTHLLRREAGRRLVVLDPNVRPAALDDRWHDVLADALAVVDVVKVSDEDLALLHSDEPAEAVAARWATRGPGLVVVTRGPDGAVAFGPAGRVEVPGAPVAVVDTVGAGDAFTAGLLTHLVRRDATTRAAIDGMDRAAVTAALHHAVRTATVTCGRAGADPPTRRELDGATPV